MGPIEPASKQASQRASERPTELPELACVRRAQCCSVTLAAAAIPVDPARPSFLPSFSSLSSSLNHLIGPIVRLPLLLQLRKFCVSMLVSESERTLLFRAYNT